MWAVDPNPLSTVQTNKRQQWDDGGGHWPQEQVPLGTPASHQFWVHGQSSFLLIYILGSSRGWRKCLGACHHVGDLDRQPLPLALPNPSCLWAFGKWTSTGKISLLLSPPLSNSAIYICFALYIYICKYMKKSLIEGLGNFLKRLQFQIPWF